LRKVFYRLAFCLVGTAVAPCPNFLYIMFKAAAIVYGFIFYLLCEAPAIVCFQVSDTCCKASYGIDLQVMFEYVVLAIVERDQALQH